MRLRKRPIPKWAAIVLCNVCRQPFRKKRRNQRCCKLACYYKGWLRGKKRIRVGGRQVAIAIRP